MDENREKSIVIWGLIYMVIAAIMLVALVSGCCPKVVEKVVTETKIEYRDRIVHDTATFEVPVEVEKIVTRDTMSHLSNSFAKSEAIVSGGFLFHSLESIPQTIEVPVEVHVTDTLYVEKEATVVEKEVEVEKELSWWKRARLGLFPWISLGLIISLGWIFKKPLLAILKNLLKI